MHTAKASNPVVRLLLVLSVSGGVDVELGPAREGVRQVWDVDYVAAILEVDPSEVEALVEAGECPRPSVLSSDGEYYWEPESLFLNVRAYHERHGNL